MFLGFMLSCFISVGSLENQFKKDTSYSFLSVVKNDSTKMERARRQAIIKSKQQYGCVIPNYKKIAAAKKREAEVQKKKLNTIY